MRAVFFIVEFHALGHSDCSLNYNTSQFKTRIFDSSLAEQKNSPLSFARNSFSLMDQGSFLLMLRFKLACLNIYQKEHGKVDSSVVFWRPPPKRPYSAYSVENHAAEGEPELMRGESTRAEEEDGDEAKDEDEGDGDDDDEENESGIRMLVDTDAEMGLDILLQAMYFANKNLNG